MENFFRPVQEVKRPVMAEIFIKPGPTKQTFLSRTVFFTGQNLLAGNVVFGAWFGVTKYKGQTLSLSCTDVEHSHRPHALTASLGTRSEDSVDGGAWHPASGRYKAPRIKVVSSTV
jgi:hypothetical protein